MKDMKGFLNKTPTTTHTQRIIRDEDDHDMFRLYGGIKGKYRSTYRLMCIIHIDDLTNLFGQTFYEEAIKLREGQPYDLTITASLEE